MTYTEAQYSTPSAMAMIVEKFLPAVGAEGYSKRDIDCAARYISQVLRVGSMATCRALVLGAIKQQADDQEPFRNGPDTNF
jgi:hypothetical protein